MQGAVVWRPLARAGWGVVGSRVVVRRGRLGKVCVYCYVKVHVNHTHVHIFTSNRRSTRTFVFLKMCRQQFHAFQLLSIRRIPIEHFTHLTGSSLIPTRVVRIPTLTY